MLSSGPISSWAISGFRQYLNAAVSDSATGSDAVATSSVFAAIFSDAATVTEITASGFLWNPIDDSQGAVWQPVSDSQAAIWAAINDSQAAVWQSINDAQASTWTPVNDAQGTTWTDINPNDGNSYP